MLINSLIMRFLVMMTIMCFIAWGNGRLPELWLHPNDLRLNERIRSLAPQITRQPSHNSTEKVQSREIPCNPPKIVFQWLPSSSWWLHWLVLPKMISKPFQDGAFNDFQRKDSLLASKINPLLASLKGIHSIRQKINRHCQWLPRR